MCVFNLIVLSVSSLSGWLALFGFFDIHLFRRGDRSCDWLEGYPLMGAGSGGGWRVVRGVKCCDEK